MKHIHTFESFLNESSQYDLVEVSPDHVQTDNDIYTLIDTLRKKGVYASTGARQTSDILVPRGKGKQAASILKDAGYSLKESTDSIDEAASAPMGPKVKELNKMLDNLVDTFVQAVKNEKEEGGDLPEEYYAGIKTLGLKKEEAGIVFSATVGNRNKVMTSAQKAGVKFVEVEDSETGDSAIVFSLKQ